MSVLFIRLHAARRAMTAPVLLLQYPYPVPDRYNRYTRAPRCVIFYLLLTTCIYYPATCGPKGDGSGSAAVEATAVGFSTYTFFPRPQTGHSRVPVSLSPRGALRCVYYLVYLSCYLRVESPWQQYGFTKRSIPVPGRHENRSLYLRPVLL